jgi:O-antigen ligase
VLFRSQHALGLSFRGPTEEEVEINAELVAHNTFLSVLVEQGVIGLALFLGSLVVLMLPAFRLPALEKMFWLSFFATWVVGASTLSYEDRKLPWLLFGILTAQVASRIPSLSQSMLRKHAVGRPMSPAPLSSGSRI